MAAVTRQDLINLQNTVDMRVSELKPILLGVAAKQALMQQALADAIAAASDPEITDPEMLAAIKSLQEEPTLDSLPLPGL
jgi:phage-related protein